MTLFFKQNHRQKILCPLLTTTKTFHRYCSLVLTFLCGVFLIQQFWIGIILHDIISTSTTTNLSERQSFLSIQQQPKTKTTMQSNEMRISSNNNENDTNNAYLIYYLKPNFGQGTGNIVSGILAAHMLAEEFNRTICHIGYGSSFDVAFDWINLDHKNKCQQLVNDIQTPKPTDFNTIIQNNYDQSAYQSECQIKEMLSNHKQYPILYYKGNTYPRWPYTSVMMNDKQFIINNNNNKQHCNNGRNYFHEKFQPTQALLNILPWKISAPAIVIHLRDGDGIRDTRQGLDNETLTILTTTNFTTLHQNYTDNGSYLDGNINQIDQIFLVTNRVEWYSRFPHWGHPQWSLVHHSALKRISWGNPQGNDKSMFNGRTKTSTSTSKADDIKSRELEGTLQMWADWYTLLNAKYIYHTHSDFSLSAARWNTNIRSWTIDGSIPATKEMPNGQLVLRRDLTDVRDGLAPRLVDRTSDELKYCSNSAYDEKKAIQQQNYQRMKAARKAFGMVDKTNSLPWTPHRGANKEYKPDNAKTGLLVKDSFDNKRSYLIYVYDDDGGQGAGNIVSGILAAHLLAEEFNRTVCHLGGFKYQSSFGLAFRFNDPKHAQICELVLENAPTRNVNNTIVQRNYNKVQLSECLLKKKLMNHKDYPILYYIGNTYPRWPTRSKQLSRNYFDEYFQPTESLLAILPWNIENPPSIVVHLRQGDDKLDKRTGLDDQTLSLLASYDFVAKKQASNNSSSSDVFLVTNQVKWYTKFSNWSHPNWSIVQHSVFGYLWGFNKKQAPATTISTNNNDNINPKRQALEEERLHMWSDWYTMLKSHQLYHTPSDFSLSAARWNQNIQSWTILGSQHDGNDANNPIELILQAEFQDEEILEDKSNSKDRVPRLVDRSDMELKYCQRGR